MVKVCNFVKWVWVQIFKSVRASAATLFILSLHVESSLYVESHFFSISLQQTLYFIFIFIKIIFLLFYFNFFFSLLQAANPTSKTRQQPPLHQAADSKPRPRSASPSWEQRKSMENRGRAQRREGKKWKREKEIKQNERERKK